MNNIVPTTSTEIAERPKFEEIKTKKKKRTANAKRELRTYIIFMIWPVLQFVIFYIGVNFNTIMFAFQKYDGANFVFDSSLHAFEQVGHFLTVEGGWRMFGFSIIFFLISTCISVPLGLLFSYYIAKKLPGHGFFRVVLFLPSILSAIVTATLFRFFVQYALPQLVQACGGTFQDPFASTASAGLMFGVVIFYNIWVGFGTSVLMYSNKISGISPEIMEAAHLDGARGFKEFWHIILPQVFPTLSVFLVASVAGIFINQAGLYSLFARDISTGFPANVISIETLGFYLFSESRKIGAEPGYPKLAVIGIMLTAIAIPITFLVRRLLNKFGPSED